MRFVTCKYLNLPIDRKCPKSVLNQGLSPKTALNPAYLAYNFALYEVFCFQIVCIFYDAFKM